MSEAVEPPDWLPDGWIMEVRKGKMGRVYRYYTCPISEFTFCSREEAIRYLMNARSEKLVNVKPETDSSKIKKCLKMTNHKNENEVKHSPVWPRGWVVELRVRKVGGKDEEKYKRYIHRSTGSIFYSKEEVLQFLEVENICDNLISTYNGYLKTENYKTESNDLILSRVEYSPTQLPDGWIKEVKFRRNPESKKKFRQDPYYTDPQSGYVFRTCKDCFLFHEHGVLSRYAFKPRRNNVYAILGFEGPSTDSASPKRLKFEEDS
ncbi:uncharacterized protein LOC121974714 [Zingiber officinale]|uniref:uncharacterized protein LOC121974714 n=1 Tax=Zingiber officinale TaxID=94328 RepID=UPI001C4BE109|nr:uncharacterized protein LOC121974714 [Zingiber officinale]